MTGERIQSKSTSMRLCGLVFVIIILTPSVLGGSDSNGRIPGVYPRASKRTQRPRATGSVTRRTPPGRATQPAIGPAIINGTPVPSDDLYPWMGSLQFWDQWVESYIHVCGAVIIGKQYLLTAAHCVDSNAAAGRDDPAMYRVRVGSTQLYALDTSAQTAFVTSFTQNPGWGQSGSQQNDISIIKLTSPLVMTSSVDLIQLPVAGSDYTGAASTILGWGLTDTPSDGGTDTTGLQEGRTSVMSNSDCQTQVPLDVTDAQVCTPGGTEAATICMGDSGGPMTVQGSDTLWVVVGVSSYSYNQCSGYPSVYTRVSQYLTWITQNT